MRSFPTKIEAAIRSLGLEPRSVLYAFQSFARTDAMTGETWLLIGRDKKSSIAVLLTCNALQDVDLGPIIRLEDIREIKLSETFLRELNVQFMNKAGSAVLSMIVPGSQNNQWAELSRDLESVYGGKVSWVKEEAMVEVETHDLLDCEDVKIFEEAGGPYEMLKKTSLTKVAGDLEKTMERLRTLDVDITMGEFQIAFPEDTAISIDKVEEFQEKSGEKTRSRRRPRKDRPKPEPPPEPPNQVRCFKCGRMNASSYAFCLACGKPLHDGESKPASRPGRKILAGLKGTPPGAEVDSGGCVTGCLTQFAYLIIISFALMIILFLSN